MTSKKKTAKVKRAAPAAPATAAVELVHATNHPNCTAKEFSADNCHCAECAKARLT